MPAATRGIGTTQDHAAAVGLRFVSDRDPGIRRKRRRGGFDYIDADGRRVRTRDIIDRIEALAVPPAWKDVWICPHANGHLQATGRDARGRKQYRYHARWNEARDANKFDRMVEFGRALPRIRRRCDRDMRRPGLPREKVLATVVKLLEKSLIRVGNREYERDNQSYGLTTMKNRHVDIHGAKIRFSFRGKSGVQHSVGVTSRRVANVVRRLQELPGQELFQYVDEDGATRGVESTDVNGYLQEISGHDFTAKDFRTWTGTVLAMEALTEMRRVDSEVEAKRNVMRAIENVASRLGNTVAVCRKSYVHPAITDAYLDGSLLETLEQRADDELRRIDRLGPVEAAVLAVLRRRLKRQSSRRRAS